METAEAESAVLPWRLRVVGLVFVFAGACDVISVIISLLHDQFFIRLEGPLLIWLGIRLLKRSEGALAWGLALAWYVLIVGGLIGGLSPALRDQGR